MSELFVGQNVVCIDPQGMNDEPSPLVRGEIYTIKAFNDVGGLILRECNPPEPYYGFSRTLFKPIESKAISIFRKIAQDVTEGRKVEIVG